jgi:hypothetical protein
MYKIELLKSAAKEFRDLDDTTKVKYINRKSLLSFLISEWCSGQRNIQRILPTPRNLKKPLQLDFPKKYLGNRVKIFSKKKLCEASDLWLRNEMSVALISSGRLIKL